MPVEQTHFCADEATLAELGRSVGGRSFSGAVLALVGPLGAGKTCFTRALAQGLGLADARQVTSPTFILHQSYAARLNLHHFDVYRLKSQAEFVDLGALELLEGDGVCVIEWADRIENLLPADHLRVTFALPAEGGRQVTLTALGPRHAVLLAITNPSCPRHP